MKKVCIECTRSIDIAAFHPRHEWGESILQEKCWECRRKKRGRSYKHKRRHFNTEALIYRDILLNDLCAYCGKTSDNVDHIIPARHAGSSRAYNLTASCFECNNKKSNYSLLEFLLGERLDVSYRKEARQHKRVRVLYEEEGGRIVSLITEDTYPEINLIKSDFINSSSTSRYTITFRKNKKPFV